MGARAPWRIQAGIQAHVMTLQNLSQSPSAYLDRDLGCEMVERGDAFLTMMDV